MQRERSWHVWHIKETNLTKRGYETGGYRDATGIGCFRGATAYVLLPATRNDVDDDERPKDRRRSRAIYRTKESVVRARCRPPSSPAESMPRSAEMFSELRPAKEPEKPGVRVHSLSLSLFPSLLDFSFSRCMLLFYESWYFRQSSTSVAFRKGVLGPIISREYHYGYNAPVWSGPLYQDRAAYTDGPYECAKRERERERERE